MEIFRKNIEHFLACAKAESFKNAAHSLGITHASLSIAIKQLEGEVGFRLFDRKPKGAVLTEKGRLLYESLQLQKSAAQRSLLKIASRQEDIPLRIGVVSHFGERVFLPMFQQLKEQIPATQLFLGFSLTIHQAVRDGELDFGFIGWTKRPEDVASIKIKSDPMAIVGQKKRFKHIENARSLDDLRNEPWAYQPKPQYDWTNILEYNRSGFVTDNLFNYRSLLLNGHAIGVAQLDMFSAAELKTLAIAPVTADTSVTIYLVYNDSKISSFAKQQLSLVQKLFLK